jgi:hypothetical protein
VRVRRERKREKLTLSIEQMTPRREKIESTYITKEKIF